MFLNSDNSISRVTRKLWPLPVFVIPFALGICYLAAGVFGSALTAFVITFSILQVVMSGAVWMAWRSSHEQLTGVKLELSSLQGIVDVSRDAIIGITPDGVIMSWNRGARGIYGYTAKEALGSPLSMLFDHRKGLEASSLFRKGLARRERQPARDGPSEERPDANRRLAHNLSNHGRKDGHRRFSRGP
jgi:PAS domain S-box-containing protein